MAVEFKKVFNKLVEVGIFDRFAEEVHKKLPRLIRIQDLTPEFTARFIGLTSQGFVPLIFGGHFDHIDPVVESHFCQYLIDLAEEANLGKNLKGFVATLARSVPGGQQSHFMQVMYPHMEAYAKERKVEFIPITREQDVEMFGMKLGLSEKRPLISKLRQKGMGGLILPGGSVQPGRHPKGASGDQIFGLQEIKGYELLTLFDFMERSGRHFRQQPYFLPIGVSRTYRLFSSDSKLPTPEGLISLYDRLSYWLGIFGFKRIYVDIRVGMPITGEDMKNNLGSDWMNNPQESTFFLMKNAAQFNLPHERGFYNEDRIAVEKVTA